MRIGVDPGLDGAIAWLNDGCVFIQVIDMPTMANTGNRRQVNAAELTRIIQNGGNNEKPLTVYLERASSMPGQGVSSMFSFGMSFGIVLGVIAALEYPVELVTPQKWKKRAGLTGKDKDYARTLAQLFYPEAELGRKKDIGRADAILIARFGERS